MRNHHTLTISEDFDEPAGAQRDYDLRDGICDACGLGEAVLMIDSDDLCARCGLGALGLCQGCERESEACECEARASEPDDVRFPPA